MTCFSFYALLALASVGFATAGFQEPLQGSGSLLSDKWKWTQCGKPSDPVRIKSIQVSPDPPQPGANMTVTVVGQANEQIEDGAYADVSVKVGRIQLIHREFDLCEEARNAHTDIQCPVEEGEYTVVHTVELPKEIPKAPFNVAVRGFTVEDEPLVCLDLTIDFRT
ncbi:hypothetical protein PHLGIDRAFT_81580 [Phlebiopsis gigantea 11061_1 CR5-6]|uniref:Phosphatidylglycerol/phosphatidylinositol transfer protein n=1 Tax=Phlebiopsis gigantea (strain 11061_1 CR5-6) TaxID=745531 RepID=A0A0C3PWN6_PHLG1|nr:hypothetical protein PHLGIDRAFT_81580 [Phlebiopsis gigantea 11061_1 CR5-6]